MIYEYSLFDDQGRLISKTVRKKAKLKGDWIVFYKQPLRKLIERTDIEPSILRIYFWLASKQTFENYVMVTRKKIAKDLNLSRNTVFKALKFLQNEGYLKIVDLDGNTGFLLNPVVTVKGAKQKFEKMTMWEKIKSIAEVKIDNEKMVDSETGEIIYAPPLNDA